jgi:hypothetical protein
LRGRVKAARATVATTPGAAEVIRQDRVKVARFYARFGISEALFRHGVRDILEGEADNRVENSDFCTYGTNDRHEEQ